MWTGNNISLYQKATIFIYLLLYYLVAILYEYVQTFQNHLGQVDFSLNMAKKLRLLSLTIQLISRSVQSLDTLWT